MRIRIVLAAACLVAAAAAAEEGAAPKETPKSAEFGGVSVGMTLTQVAWTLEANGFRASQSRKRRYIDDSGEVKRRIRFRELPGPDGKLTVYELDETAWYPVGSLDAEAFEAELRERFGEPRAVNDGDVGRRELVYAQAGPSVVEVIAACQKEIQEKDPELSAEEAEAKAASVAQYSAANEDLAKVCPGAEPVYRQMAEALEAPRLTVVMRSARVDSMVRWPWVEAELVRRLGPEQAAKVIAFGPNAVEAARKPAPKP